MVTSYSSQSSVYYMVVAGMKGSGTEAPAGEWLQCESRKIKSHGILVLCYIIVGLYYLLCGIYAYAGITDREVMQHRYKRSPKHIAYYFKKSIYTHHGSWMYIIFTISIRQLWKYVLTK